METKGLFSDVMGAENTFYGEIKFIDPGPVLDLVTVTLDSSNSIAITISVTHGSASLHRRRREEASGGFDDSPLKVGDPVTISFPVPMGFIAKGH